VCQKALLQMRTYLSIIENQYYLVPPDEVDGGSHPSRVRKFIVYEEGNNICDRYIHNPSPFSQKDGSIEPIKMGL
jgi:hypothetical protein